LARAFEGLGTEYDYVDVLIGGQKFAAITYAISSAFFSRQPSSFTANIRVGEPLRDAYKKITPGMQFEVRIDDVLQMSGRLDAVNGSVSQSGSILNVSGRDILAKLHDATADKDYGFAEGTYLEVVQKVLKIVNIDAPLIFSNDANRAAVSKKKQKVLKTVTTTGKGKTGFDSAAMHIKSGESWYPWLSQILNHSGIILRATARGELSLTAPNPDQQPTYTFTVAPAQDRGRKFVTAASRKNDTTTRASKVIVRCKGGGKQSGSKDVEGVAIDDEMVAYGIERVRTIKDFKGSSVDAAERFAKRKIAEMRRTGFFFNYELVGHSWQSDDRRDSAIFTPDTIAQVNDHEHGYFGALWIESVDMARGPATTTQITCMRPDDVRFFGET
jgi:prophage tail gpP-like protein